jgi:hypothetical protein
VLNELESQNDAQVEGIMGKVRTLKDVSYFFFFFFASRESLLSLP